MSAEQSWNLEASELARVTGGQLLSSVASTFSRVGTDTRQDLKGRLFVPLKGANFEGHDFVAQAVDKGASAVLFSQWREEWRPLLGRASFVQVSDTLAALQSLARHWRRIHNFKVIGITGSNGKTSTKEFTSALLKPHLRMHSAKGSYNNHWGVPLTILEAGPDITHLILEMGMNHAGEIWRLCQVAEPDVVVVTTVGRAHIGQLGSIEAIAQAKEEIYTAAPKALHVFNVDNEWTMRMQARSRAQQLTFSAFKSAADVHLRAQRFTWEGLELVGHLKGQSGQAKVKVFGRHNTVNLMAASTLALAAGLTPEQIWQGLARIQDVAWGRNQLLLLENGAHILFDGYNANPDSMIALIKNLYEMEGVNRKFLIVGDMLEQGEFTDKVHEEIGEQAAAVAGLNGIWYVGQNFKAFQRGLEKNDFKLDFVHTPVVDPGVARQVHSWLRPGDLVAIKASRGLALEKVFEHWPLKTPLCKKP